MIINKKYLLFLFITAVFTGCGDMESMHEEYLQGEKVYAGKLDSLMVYSGYKRVKIEGLTHYLGQSNVCIVKWEGQTREFPIDHTSNGKFEMIVDGLEERNYEFRVYTKDIAGNESILQTCKGKSIGDIFKESQINRRITGYNFSGALFSALWSDKAESEYVVYTVLKYENNNGTLTEAIVMPDNTSTVLTNWKAGGKVEIQSAILTGDMGFDTLKLNVFEDKLPSESVFLLDKKLFSVVRLSKDTPGDGYGGKISGMWDGVKGSGQGSRYHTRDGEGVPHTLTFDLGITADLDRIEITGREGYNNWNLKQVQLWGCENIDNKDTNRPASDPAWEQEALDKGWKLLIDTGLSDPYENLVLFDKEKTRKVRYIRIRAMEVVGPPSSGSGAYGCIQEITLWGENILAVE
jgi:hypothetical protein